MRTRVRILAMALLVTLGALAAAPAEAAVLTMLLVRSSLTGVTDAAGSWQYEGGVIENATTSATIGHYTAARRYTTAGDTTDNSAAATYNLLFTNATAGDPPNNLTLEGTWSFNVGAFSGSISAASSRYHVMIGMDANGTTPVSGQTKLVIDCVGVLALP